MQSPASLILVPCIFVGITWTVGNVVAVIAAHDSVTHDKIGVATGMVYTLFNVGGSIVLALSIVIFKTVESSFLQKALSTHHIDLSASEKSALSSALADPSKASSILSHLGDMSTQVIELFRKAFVQGMHGVATLLVIVSLLIVCVTWLAKRKCQKQS